MQKFKVEVQFSPTVKVIKTRWFYTVETVVDFVCELGNRTYSVFERNSDGRWVKKFYNTELPA